MQERCCRYGKPGCHYGKEFPAKILSLVQQFQDAHEKALYETGTQHEAFLAWQRVYEAEKEYWRHLGEQV